MSFPHLHHAHLAGACRRALVAALALSSIALAPGAGAALAAQVPGGAPSRSVLPEFTILIFERTSDLSRRTDPARADAYWTAYDDFAASLAQAGALRGGSALSETVAATVRGTGSADRGVAEARLGGYFVIAAADLEAARRLAAAAPAFAVAVEVRPHRENPHMAKMEGARR